jgi:hypothetical protein
MESVFLFAPIRLLIDLSVSNYDGDDDSNKDDDTFSVSGVRSNRESNGVETE